MLHPVNPYGTLNGNLQGTLKGTPKGHVKVTLKRTLNGTLKLTLKAPYGYMEPHGFRVGGLGHQGLKRVEDFAMI